MQYLDRVEVNMEAIDEDVNTPPPGSHQTHPPLNLPSKSDVEPFTGVDLDIFLVSWDLLHPLLHPTPLVQFRPCCHPVFVTLSYSLTQLKAFVQKGRISNFGRFSFFAGSS